MGTRSLKGKKCFITGAASGIGRALAEACAERGAVLFLADIDAARLDAAATALRGRGGAGAWSGALAVSDFERVCEAAAQIRASHGSMDLVMNVAGISIWGAVDKLEHRDWRRCVDINLMGPIHVIESFVPAMMAAGRGGHLVNVSSAAGLFGLPWHAAYSASKFGLRGVSEVLRFDLERHGIRVHLVCPGGVDTGLVQTIEIRGVDRAAPRMTKLRELFRRHARTPAQAAEAILRGVEKGRYLIFTSPDVAVGWWFQRKWAWPYEVVMRLMNRRLQKALLPQVD